MSLKKYFLVSVGFQLNFCSFRLMFEFPPVGGLVTSSKIRAVKLIRYVNALDYFVLACEILFMLFIVYYTIEEALEVI